MTALLTTRKVATRLRLSTRTLERLRCAGTGPKFVPVGNRSIRYRQQDLDTYVATRVVASTSEKHQ
jgi:predicted DNA-binding transcriptional regulator AlpA